MRAGGYTLRLLSTPRIPAILRSLVDGSKSRQELRRDTGLPAHSTLRNQLCALEQARILERRRTDGPPELLEYNLTESGRRLLAVIDSLAAWLAISPGGALTLGEDPARAAIKALAGGWLARMLTPLSAQPHSLTELDKGLSHTSYPTIERRLEWLRMSEQVDDGTQSARGTQYSATDWLRLGIGPIAHAARWEHHACPEEADPITRCEIDSALTIATPFLRLSPRASEICQFAARSPIAGSRDRSLYMVEIQAGRPASSSVYPRRRPHAWASGKTDDWFAALIEGETGRLRLSGERHLPLEIFERARRVLTVEPAEIGPFPK